LGTNAAIEALVKALAWDLMGAAAYFRVKVENIL
jgi:hypothetical protein